MSSRRVICRSCGRAAVWAIVYHEDVELGGREGGRWLHATDAIRSPGQPQASADRHPVDPTPAAKGGNSPLTASRVRVDSEATAGDRPPDKEEP